jgi:membrane-bound metal-dependent hydrolase YbcI (DUF457 family)
MPFTAFHFGPGAAIKTVIPAHFNFTVFCVAQVVTDLEPAYYLFRGEYPVHRFFHTCVGATVVGSFCALAGRPLLQYFTSARIPLRSAWFAALIGTYSHVFLDSIMHPDMVPFRPFTTVNPMLHLMDVGLLHVLCVVLGVLGAFRLFRVKKP